MSDKLNCCCGGGRICPSHGDTTPEERQSSLAAATGSAGELANLRRRVQAQRRELKRLNKEMSGPKAAYWWGFRKGLDARSESELRGKMNAAFGYKAVWEAEHGLPYPERSQSNNELSERRAKDYEKQK